MSHVDLEEITWRDLTDIKTSSLLEIIELCISELKLRDRRLNSE